MTSNFLFVTLKIRVPLPKLKKKDMPGVLLTFWDAAPSKLGLQRKLSSFAPPLPLSER
jgi:hypothetical protein